MKALQFVLAPVLLLGCLSGTALSQRPDTVEKKLMRSAHDVEYAVIPLMYWGSHGHEPEKAGVVGTGFLINEDGYFVTAAHVLALYESDSAQLTATIRQKDGNGGGRWFDVIDKDESRDLALCKIKGFTPHFPKAMVADHPDSQTPFASLQVSDGTVQTGQFVVLAGFPLGSWNPTIQLGTIAAVKTVSPLAGRVPAGQRELLQISVSGNKGNSGSPVISLDSGKVVGVIVQAVPAPAVLQRRRALAIRSELRDHARRSCVLGVGASEEAHCT
jgi:S1-C subfamily serine protease